MAKIQDSLSCWFYYFTSCLSSKDKLISIIFFIFFLKPYKVKDFKKEWQTFRPKWSKIKIICHYCIFVIKKKNKDRLHVTNKHNIQKVYFSVCVFSSSI